MTSSGCYADAREILSKKATKTAFTIKRLLSNIDSLTAVETRNKLFNALVKPVLLVHSLWKLIGNSCLKRSPYWLHWLPWCLRGSTPLLSDLECLNKPQSHFFFIPIKSSFIGVIILSTYCQYASYSEDHFACSLYCFLMRHFNEGGTYTCNSSPFLELVNLCGLNLLIPEVNFSWKLDHKSFIDRLQSEECMIESKYLDMCSLRPTQSAFLYKGTIRTVNLFFDCYFDITLKKHSIMITKPWDGLSLDDNTVIVRYKQV